MRCHTWAIRGNALRRGAVGWLRLTARGAIPLLVCAAADALHSDAMHGAEPSPSLPPPTLAEIRREVLAVHDRIDSVDCTYRVSGAPVAPGEPARYSRHRVVQKGRLRFAENVHFTASTPPDLDLNHTRQYFTVETFDCFYVQSRFFETSARHARGSSPWKLRIDPYLTLAGWWPKDDDAPPDNPRETPFRPLRTLLAQEGCWLEPLTDTVDGHACVVVSRAKADRVWLDPTLCYAIRRREVLHPATGQVAAAIRCREFQEHPLAEGCRVWFPLRIDVVRPAATPGGHGPNREGDDPLSSGTTLQAEALHFNGVADEAFRFVPPPGTLIQDRDTGQFSLTPGGMDLLDHSVSLAERLLDAGQRARTPARSLHVIAAAVLVALSLGVGLRLVAQRRLRTVPAPDQTSGPAR